MIQHQPRIYFTLLVTFFRPLPIHSSFHRLDILPVALPLWVESSVPTSCSLVDQQYQIHLCSSVFICGYKFGISTFARGLAISN